MIQNKEALMQAREDAKKVLASYDCRILVCSGTGCIATGSEKIYQKFVEICKDAPGVTLEFAPHDAQEHKDQLGVKKTGCHGICELGPLVRIQKGDKVIQYTKVKLDDCEEIFERSVKGNDVVESLLYKQKGQVYQAPEDIPFIKKQTRLVLENCGKLEAESFEEYLAGGGFLALEKALFDVTPDQIIDEVDKSLFVREMR